MPPRYFLHAALLHDQSHTMCTLYSYIYLLKFYIDNHNVWVRISAPSAPDLSQGDLIPISFHHSPLPPSSPPLSPIPFNLSISGPPILPVKAWGNTVLTRRLYKPSLFLILFPELLPSLPSHSVLFYVLCILSSFCNSSSIIRPLHRETRTPMLRRVV